MVKVEDATEGSVVMTEWFGMSPNYYGFGMSVEAERRHILEALLPEMNSFNTALERTAGELLLPFSLLKWCVYFNVFIFWEEHAMSWMNFDTT